MTINNKINERMTYLASLVDDGMITSNPSMIIDAIDNVAKFWSILPEADRDYINSIRDAVRQEDDSP